MDPNKSVEDEEKKEAKGSPGSGVRQRRKAGTPESDSSGSGSSKSRPKFVLPKKTIIVRRQTSKVSFNSFCLNFDRIKSLKQFIMVVSTYFGPPMFYNGYTFIVIYKAIKF